MKKFITFLRWELSPLFRLRMFLPLVAFAFFTSYLGAEARGSSGVRGMDVPLKSLAGHVGRSSFMALEGMYLAFAFFSAILVSASLAGEMDVGILKHYLSLPVGRLEVFIAKAMASYILLLSVGSGAICYRMAMSTPEAFLRLLAASPFYLLQPSLFLALQLLFTFSISLYFSVISRRAWHASLYSLFTLYSFYTVRLVAPRLKWYLPPYVFTIGFFELTNVLYFTLFSIILTTLSAYIFVRRLEVS